MAQQTNRSNPANQPAKGAKTREGDEPQDIREAKPKHDHVDSKDGGRDRNPGDMRREDESKETDPKGTGFDESESDLDDNAGDPKFTGENETNASGGSHIKNPNPRNR
jgi:hypothetical protein